MDGGQQPVKHRYHRSPYAALRVEYLCGTRSDSLGFARTRTRSQSRCICGIPEYSCRAVPTSGSQRTCIDLEPKVEKGSDPAPPGRSYCRPTSGLGTIKHAGLGFTLSTGCYREDVSSEVLSFARGLDSCHLM